jgi:predicted SPOUT superfamily RNA methylase MTH1
MRSGLHGTRLAVAIPVSIVSDTPHLREKTGKLGLIARACSIFQTAEIILYADDARRDQKSEFELCEKVLQFIETPQYLRKKLFRLTPNLRYTGILPPLQTPPHNVSHSLRESKVGDLREGLIVGKRGDSLLVDVGLEKPLECPGDFPVGQKVTTKITRVTNDSRGEIVKPSPVDAVAPYWGYKVVKADSSLAKFVKGRGFDLKIGTSRYGTPVGEIWSRLAASLSAAKHTLIAFGSPRMGLREILAQENETPGNVFNYFVNTVPAQEVTTVRTEEAILISLGILNLATSIY